MYRSCILAALVLLVGCGRAQGPTSDVVVSVAISISEAMQQVAFDFEEGTGLRVALNIGGSDTLATQLIAGASVDLFVSADLRQMTRVELDGGILTASKVNLLSNQLVLVTHGDNPRYFSGIGDLAESNIRRVAMGDPDAVPAGVYARQFLQVSGLWNAVRDKVVPTRNVRAVIAAVEAGNVDAGFVYRTDVSLVENMKIVVAIPVGKGPEIRYVAAVTANAPNESGARQFLDFLSSEASMHIFEDYGFIALNGEGR